jgi:hypothetical protein
MHGKNVRKHARITMRQIETAWFGWPSDNCVSPRGLVLRGAKIRESDESAGMREKMPASCLNLNGSAERMRASGKLSAAWAGMAAAMARAVKPKASATARNAACEGVMVEQSVCEQVAVARSGDPLGHTQRQGASFQHRASDPPMRHVSKCSERQRRPSASRAFRTGREKCVALTLCSPPDELRASAQQRACDHENRPTIRQAAAADTGFHAAAQAATERAQSAIIRLRKKAGLFK